MESNGKSPLRNDRIRERRDVYLTGPTCQKRNLLVLIHTDHPFQWDMQEGGTLYEMVRLYINWCSVARRSHLISISTLRLTLAKTDKPSQPLNFDDGRWKIMMELGCGLHYAPGFAIQLTAGSAERDISSVDNQRHHVLSV